MATIGDDPQPGPERGTEGPAPPNNFHLFPLLPAELRLKIWHHSFEPRIVELHGRRSHYADDHKHGGVARWQSGCNNPAALSVSVEARTAALSHFTMRIPLDAMSANCDFPGATRRDAHRALYISPADDTVAVLGSVDFTRLSALLADVRRLDTRRGRGLRRLAVSAQWTYHAGASAMMRVLARTMFRDLDELVLFMFGDRVPPPGWAGGVCVLTDCSQTEYFKRYDVGRGSELKDGGSWMIVGKKELRLADLSLRPGW
ncbi:hypothetical protein QBC33DRAFT_454839 [Phialemonium atrogriseum]|uniref:2EXR domain-containing protein n=1 Tax=Phialemonium atrogriseum TaxID=1093897 RepID=A0AAJ0BWM4_9PEZI|nr:uncharacterized protein QBC33DRAFT_454839 [Phialemonium atrogriseum]KAK1765616.1 hypothetical protein QBC33DRAFT_454839 [Phialemonium atrogriseum]